MEIFAFENRRINAGQNVLGLRNQADQLLVFNRSKILLAIQGKSYHDIALRTFSIGVDQPEATALTFINRRVGNANLESIEIAYACQQSTNALTSLDGLKNWIQFVKEQLIAFTEPLEVFLKLLGCPKSQSHAQSVMGLIALCFTDDVLNGPHITSRHLSQRLRQPMEYFFFLCSCHNPIF